MQFSMFVEDGHSYLVTSAALCTVVRREHSFGLRCGRTVHVGELFLAKVECFFVVEVSLACGH